MSDTSRTSVRAQLLHLIDRALLARPTRIITRRVTAWELRRYHRLLGALRMQLDLAFRASFSPAEIIETAERGIVRIALHPALPAFPIGVVLAMPTKTLPRARVNLWENDVLLAEARFIVPFALATNPTNIGAGVALIEAVVNDRDELPSCPRVVTFSPLTGLRARVIRAIDEDLTGDQLRDELRFLLHTTKCPSELPILAGNWLRSQADEYAVSTNYAAGNFHRATGAELLWLSHCADPDDCDAMWTRAYFDYTSTAQTRIRGNG